MIGITLIAGMMAGYGYGASPPSSSYQGSGGTGVDTAPFVQLERKCLDQAVNETRDAGLDVRQQRFNTCFSLHDAMVKHATAKLGEKEAAGVKLDIDHALRGVEKTYAMKLGVAIPGESK